MAAASTRSRFLTGRRFSDCDVAIFASVTRNLHRSRIDACIAAKIAARDSVGKSPRVRALLEFSFLSVDFQPWKGEKGWREAWRLNRNGPWIVNVNVIPGRVTTLIRVIRESRNAPSLSQEIRPPPLLPPCPPSVPKDLSSSKRKQDTLFHRFSGKKNSMVGAAC